MDKIKIILKTILNLIILTGLITLMIRSYVLEEWIFASAYLFVLLSLQQLGSLQSKLDSLDKIEKFRENLEKLKNFSEELKSYKENKEEGNDE